MGYSRAKTRFVASKTFERVLTGTLSGRAVYYWTLTMADNVTSKDIAEARLKPVKDLIKRKGGVMAGVWENQKRGAWHVHFLTNLYLDVNQFRPWLVQRGWGPIMRVERCQVSGHPDGEGRWIADVSSVQRLVRYLGKYVTKSLVDHNGVKYSRVFFASGDVKAGTTRFSWRPEINPSAYLYYWGKFLFYTVYGRCPTFEDVKTVIRLGVEETDWLSVDPWWMPPD